VKFLDGDDGRNSKITFICNSTVDIGFPTYVNENPVKEYNLVWITKAACPLVKNCNIKYNNTEISFSKLRNIEKNYVTRTSDRSFQMNICGGLVDSPFPDSIAVEITSGSMVSLGNANAYQISYNATNNAIEVNFSGGFDGRSATYFLLCDSSIPIGSPVFFSEAPLKHYVFIWLTSVACPANQKNIDPQILRNLKELLSLK